MNLLFDLDGTLTDPGLGIARCLQHALSALGRQVPSVPELSWCVGPPLRGTLAKLLGSSDAEMLDRATGLYRERFVSLGMFENSVYPGVVAGLGHLRKGGHQLWVVTSKPQVYARKILAHFCLADAFVSVYGSELSGENADKATLIRSVLSIERFNEQPRMVGDRCHDIEAAHANGLPGVGVLWGYGSRAELEAAGSDTLVESMEQLCEWAGRPSSARGGTPSWSSSAPTRREER
jgi:phosphoglycolate phosphatase